ncbi:cytochrome P450 3A30-like [Oppia nitens]|uniref:cytochrome P450 3A30-like n=1 Tax=Oppia nitens TaxID=1686743 RepID=UPI0023D9EDC2|nr:cytochrome P450 3A30-like [Oppia nitens]
MSFFFLLFPLLLLLLHSIFRRIRVFQTFSRIGISGPKPNLFFGNLRHLRQNPNPNDVIDLWTRQFGRVFGFFRGAQPVLVVGHWPLVRRLFGSSLLPNRPKNVIKAVPFVDSVIFVRNQSWRRIRSVIVFALKRLEISGLLRQTVRQTVEERVLQLVGDGGVCDVTLLTQEIAFDVICKAGLHWTPDSKDDIRRSLDAYLEMAVNIIVDVVTCFPPLRPILAFLNNHVTAGRVTDRVMRHVQRLLDAPEAEDECVSVLHDFRRAMATGQMTRAEAVANCHVLLIAGYETTSTALSFSLFLLAQNPQIQEQLRRQINSSSSSELLNAVWMESLRLFPPVTSFITRIVERDVSVDNLRIPAQTVVQLPLFQLHRDADLWPNPDRFDPNRFITTVSPHFLAFGLGPRDCPGRQFARILALEVISKIVGNFQISVCFQTSKLRFRSPTEVVIKARENIKLNFTRISL